MDISNFAMHKIMINKINSSKKSSYVKYMLHHKVMRQSEFLNDVSFCHYIKKLPKDPGLSSNMESLLEKIGKKQSQKWT